MAVIKPPAPSKIEKKGTEDDQFPGKPSKAPDLPGRDGTRSD